MKGTNMKGQNLKTIEKAWFEEVQRFNSASALQRLAAGELTIAHYQALLREIYFYARESPQFFSMIPVHLRGLKREYTKKILAHAFAETGHEQLALNDLKTLGMDVESIPFERPLPETSALIGFSYYLIQYLNPVSYLGFVFHLEYLPTHFGERYARGLLAAGIPPAAMSFISEHVGADVAHNRLMEDYVKDLLVTPRDVEDTIYAMRVTSNLYARVFEAAFETVDCGTSRNYGVNRAEFEADFHLMKEDPVLVGESSQG
jgi:pyrroloquinoline quinone (PQQ) biosynthesis protein C